MQQVPSTAPKKTQAVCYGCGKPGHIRPDGPLHQGNPCAAVAHIDRIEEGALVENHPEAEGQEENPPVTQVKQENDLLEGNQYLNDFVEDDGAQGIPYEWDDCEESTIS